MMRMLHNTRAAAAIVSVGSPSPNINDPAASAVTTAIGAIRLARSAGSNIDGRSRSSGLTH